MGTDIHPIVQVETADGWKPVTLPYDVHQALNARNYNTFAILGNVRNGYGFAGSDTGDVFPFISDSRGLPDDYMPDGVDHDASDCPYEGDWCDHQIELGDHSFSWVTLQELLDYPWSGQVVHRGWIPADKYDFWVAYDKREGIAPREYCSMASGGGVDSVAEEDYPRLKTADALPKVRSLYVRSSWKQRNAVSAGRLYTVVIPYLKTLGMPQSVRIVFGFDS